MQGSTNAQTEKWIKGQTVSSSTILGYGLDLTPNSYIYLPLNVAPDVTSITFTGNIWGRTPAGDQYLMANKTITFTEAGLGIWASISDIGASVNIYAIIYQLTGTWTLN